MSKSERPGFKQYVALLNEVEVIGGSNLILLDNMKALYDIKYFDIHNKILYSDQGIRFYHKEHLLIKKLHSTITYDVGIFLGGNFSWNYYHFLYEILVKFERISTMELDQSIPIFVDKICLEVPQYLELLSMLNTENRKLIPIEKCVRYKVKQLYYISCPNIIPPDLLNPSDLNPDDVLFDLNILDFLRLKMLPHSSNTSFPKRFYISRKNASNRRQFNENEVFNVLKRYGFQSVLPENYSIADQISLFNNAEFIAGGAGAALTNLLFCSKSCKVIAFSKNPVQFSGFSTIAKHVGAEMLTYTENISNSDNLQDLHESFLIDTERLDLLLSEWINT
jgi:capsular polysaccharide biosynthesis protein